MSTQAEPVQTAPTETTATVTFNPEAQEALTAAIFANRPPAEIARLRAATKVESKPAPKEEPAADAATVTETPTTEEPTETETEETATQTEEEKAAAKAPEPTEEEVEQEPKDGKPRRFRFKDPQDELIALTAKRMGISLAEASKRLAGEPKAEPHEVPNLQEQTPPHIAALETELAEVRTKLKAAKSGGVLADEQLDELEDRRAVLIAEVAQAKTAEKTTGDIHKSLSQRDFEQSRNQVLRDTAKVYPQMADRDSAQFMLAQQIGLRWRDPENPNHAKLFEPDGPRLIAEEAARVLKIAPAGKVVVAKTETVVEKPKPGPAPGSRQSSQPSPKQTAQERLAASEAQLASVLAGKTRLAKPKSKDYVM